MHLKRLLSALALFLSLPACAQQYPSRPITHIVPIEAGGPFDVFARVLSKALQANGHPGFIVENRTGANFIIAAQACTRAKPDGYTVCMLPRDNISLLPFETQVGYDPVKDLDPVTNLLVIQTVLVSHASVPASNFREFIDYAKQNPDKLNYAAFASSQMIMEWVKKQTGAPMTFVPFKGGPSAMQAFLGGQIHAMYLAVGNPGLLPLIRSGKVRALAVPADRRYATLPDTPTMVEVGLPRFPLASWMGLFAPAGTPRELRERTAKDIAEVMRHPEFRDKQMLAVGYDPIGNTPDEFARFIADDRQEGLALIKIAGPRTF
jgi:tripartite-type tricarboxylate transporter receptor subunit TctC